MKLLLFSIFPLLLFFSSLLRRVASEQILWDLVKSKHNVTTAEERGARLLQEAQLVKPELGLPWMLVYVPVRSCHRVLKEKLGEFSPPTYNSLHVNIWCNWTIWAGSRKHIIVYIKGFMTDEDCDKNEDKILFQGVSSLVENTVIYACWKKKLHVFATYGRAVHVVLLMKSSSKLRNKSFKGKYYVFKQRDIDSSSKEILVSQAPTSKPKGTTSYSTLGSSKPSIIYHGEKSDHTNIGTTSSTENLKSNFNKKTVLNNTGLLQLGGKDPNIMGFESSLPSIPRHDIRNHLLKTETLSWLRSLNMPTESKDEGKSGHFGEVLGSLPPTVLPDLWELRTSLSGEVVDFKQVYRPKSLPGFISEGPYLYVSHLNIPLKSMMLGPESRMSFSLTSLRPTDIGNLQLTIKPTHLSHPVLASYLHSVAHDRVETIVDHNMDSLPSQCLSRVTLMNDDSLLESSTLASKAMSTHSDRLTKVSLPSLRVSSQNEVVLDQPPLETRKMDKTRSYDTSSTQMVGGDKSVGELDLRTTLKNTNSPSVSLLESSFKLIDQLKIALVTATPYGMSENEHHSRLQSNEYVDLAATDLESIFPTATAVLPSTELLSSCMQDQISSSDVLHLDMKSRQQVGLAMDLEPVPSTEISVPVLTELEPVIPLPHTDGSFPPAASELGPQLFPSTEVSLPVFPTEMEPVIPFPSTEMSLTPASSELVLITSLGTEVTLPLIAKEMEPVVSSREESLPLTGQGTSTLRDELPLRTKSSHFIDMDTVLDHFHQSTPELLHSTPWTEDLWEGKPRSQLHRDYSGDPAGTEHVCGFPSTTESLNSFPAERKIGALQLILKGEREERIHEAEPGNTDENNFITNLITGNVFSDTIKLQAIKPEPELGLPGSEDHTRKLSPGTEYLARTHQWVTRMNRIKQGELMLQNGLVAANAKATPPLEHITMNTKIQLTEPIKEMSNKMVKQIVSGATPHTVQETTDWSSSPQSSAPASRDALGPVEVALKGKINSHLVQSSSDHIPEGASTAEARQLLNYIEPQFPWLLVYLPVRSCHVILKDEIGTFSPPTHSGIQTNIWCNWTIWAGPQKHILIYIKGFQGKEDCEENPDKIIFQGISSSVERQVVYACKNQGTLIFATQALAVHVVFLSRSNSLNHEHTHFKGQYYIFKDYVPSSLTNNSVDSQELVPKTTRKTKYSSIRFYPKSSMKHYRRLLDFIKTSTTHNENQLLNKLPALHKEDWNKTSSSKSLEAFLRTVLGNNTHTPLLKAMGNKTLSTSVLKQQSMKSLGNEDRSREEKPSDLLMITPALNTLRQNIQNNKKQSIAFGKLNHRPTIHSSLLSENLYLKEASKSMERQSVKSTSKPTGPQHDSAILWRPAGVEDTQPAAREVVLGNSTSRHSLQSPQGKREEQVVQTTSPQSHRVPVIKGVEMFQSKPVTHERVASHPAAFVDDFQSNSRLTKDGQEVTGQLQPLMNLTRSIKESHLEHPTCGQENNSNGDLYMKPPPALKNVKLNVEPLTLETPKKVVEAEAVPVTVALHNELDVSPVKASSYSTADSIAVEYKPLLPSSTRNCLLVKMTATAHLGTPITQDKEPPPITSTKLHPSYPSSDVVPKDTASLKVEHETDSFDTASIFTSLENDTMLESQHNPGDVLFEVTSEIDNKGWIPRNGNELKKALMESIKLHIQKNLKLLVSKVNEIKLKEIKRLNDLKPTLTFWLHLKPEERNMSVLLHSQLNDLIGKSVGAEELQLSLLSVRDVNECNSGIGVCGDEADCLNEDGTYLCRCKEEYEDRSPTKSGTLCVRIPRTGISGFFSFMEILVGATIFFIFILVVVASSLCIILRKRHTKKDPSTQERVSAGIPSTQSQPPVPSIDLSNLGEHLTLYPFQPKLRARPPEWTSQVQVNPNETYRIRVEQSERL